MIKSQPTTYPVNGVSHVVGADDRPLVEATIPSFLKEVIKRHGTRTAAVFHQTGDRWSYNEFGRLVDRLAAGLLSIGVYKGDRVGIWSPNRPEWLLAQFATARIGAILVTINPAYRTSELEYALNKVGVSCLILAPQFKTSDYIGMLSKLAPEMASCSPGSLRAERLPKLRNIVQMGSKSSPGAFDFEELMKRGNRAVHARLDAISASLRPDDAINIQFTSGTTGHPKGATLSHRNIVNNAISTARAMRLQPGEGLCIPVPFYHCFGMVLGNLAACAYGAKMVIPGEAFDPHNTLAAIDSENCAALHGVPTMFQAILDYKGFDTFDIRSLRTGIMAGAPCPEPLMRRVMERMHCRQITIAYGMTETSPISFQSAIDDPIDRRVSTVGRIQPHVECKVIGADGQTLPIGQQGELLTRGYLVMKGYWDDPERTSDAVQNGWMHTGDLATIDDEGYCRIIGRSKDMLIRGGENVYPAEIEEFLITHPNISQAQVFGLPDPKYGEEVAVWIILQSGAKMTEDELRDWCRGKIAHYKVPRYVCFVEEMPMTVTGKPQKFIMREQMIKSLELVN